MNRSHPRRDPITVQLARFVPGLAVGTPKRNVLVTLTYLVVLATLRSSLV